MYKYQMDKPPFADPDAMLLTAAIDFAVPPQANEQQIEDKINEIIHESTATTIRKVEKLWEEHFNTPPDPNVEKRVVQTVDALKQYGKRYLENPSSANLLSYEKAAEDIAWNINAFIRSAQKEQESPDKPHRQVQDVAITQKQIMDKIGIEIPKVVRSFRRSGQRGTLTSLSDIFQFLPKLFQNEFGITDEAVAFKHIDFVKLGRVAQELTNETPDATTLYNVVKGIFHQDISPQSGTPRRTRQPSVSEEGTRRTASRKNVPIRFDEGIVKTILAGGRKNEPISSAAELKKMSDEDAVKYVQHYLAEHGIIVSDQSVANFGLRREIQFFKQQGATLKPWKEALNRMIQEYGEKTDDFSREMSQADERPRKRKKRDRHAQYGRSVDKAIATTLLSYPPWEVTPELLSAQLNTFGVGITPAQIIANPDIKNILKKYNALPRDDEPPKKFLAVLQKRLESFIKDKSSGGVSVAMKKQEIPVIPELEKVTSDLLKNANKELFPKYEAMVDMDSWNENQLHPKDFPELYAKFGILVPAEVAQNKELQKIAANFNALWEPTSADPVDAQKKSYNLFQQNT